MQDHILCPHCNQKIPLTQALSHQLEQKFVEQLDQERKKMNIAAQTWKQEQLKKLEADQHEKQKELETMLKEKVKKEMELSLKNTQNEADELKKRNEEMGNQILELSKMLRQTKEDQERQKLELEKQRLEDQEKIRLAEQRRFEEQYKFQIMEKDKRIQDALKLAEDYRNKLEQGSQQLQGEVLELELENTLKQQFPYDDISPVQKGARGGDVIQTVKNSTGRECGKIIWESKRTKAWSNEWIVKLKEDQRQIRADIAVIISQVLPSTVKHFGYVDEVWVGDYHSVLGIAHALRRQLIEVSLVKNSLVGRNDKKEILYTYVYSVEFRQRVQAIAEAFNSMREDLQKEKNWFRNKWNKQEKIIQQVMDNTYGMYGDLQGIIGKGLADLEEIDMLPHESALSNTPKQINGRVEVETPKTDTLF